jgi:hypothetical protein
MVPLLFWLSVLALATTGAGPRADSPAAAGTPADRTAIARERAGSWRGVVARRELANSNHIEDVVVQVTVDPDGRWTLASGPILARGTITAMAAGVLELDARGDGHHGRRTWLHVHRVRHDFLVGLVQTEIEGSLVLTHGYLRRARPRG